MSTPENSNESGMSNLDFVVGKDWSKRPNGDEIPCPALLCFYNHGLLNPDGEGWVSLTELDRVLTIVGVSSTVRKILIKGAEDSDEERDGKFNLFRLRGGKLDHTGSTGIRDPRVQPEKLDSSLLEFSDNGRMYAKHFAAAANEAQKEDPGVKGTVTQTVEFTTILEVFGRVDETGDRFLTVDDVKSLWIDGKFPNGWKPRAENDAGVGAVTAGVAEMVLKRVWDVVRNRKDN